MWHLWNPDFFEKEKLSTIKAYPKLKYFITNNLVKLQGELEFTASFEDIEIIDSFSVSIDFPTNYPDTVPFTYETGDKIPDDYHKNPNKSLCIAPPLDVIQKFSSDPCILNYINNLLIPYLYRFSFIKKFGRAPFGEYAHGSLGLLEYYTEFLGSTNIQALCKMISIVLERSYRGHLLCPCGSKKKLRNCHGPKILELSKLPPQQIDHDFYEILVHLENELTKLKV